MLGWSIRIPNSNGNLYMSFCKNFQKIKNIFHFSGVLWSNLITLAKRVECTVSQKSSSLIFRFNMFPLFKIKFQLPQRVYCPRFTPVGTNQINSIWRASGWNFWNESKISEFFTICTKNIFIFAIARELRTYTKNEDSRVPLIFYGVYIS